LDRVLDQFPIVLTFLCLRYLYRSTPQQTSSLDNNIHTQRKWIQ